ncbi:hypothetical protein WJX77_002373 [Trebouxia sp. C0004]
MQTRGVANRRQRSYGIYDHSMTEELRQLYSVLNHNTYYDDFEAPPTNPQNASSLIGPLSNLKVPVSSSSKRILLLRR